MQRAAILRRTRVIPASEHDLQLAIARELHIRMPPNVPWSAVDHAAKLLPRQAVQRKARGVKRGQADFRFVLPPQGRCGEIEIKLPGTYQSPDQKVWEQGVLAAGGLYAVCRSMPEVEGTLKAWGVELRGDAI